MQRHIVTGNKEDYVEEIITMDYGSGGERTAQLIEKVFLPAFSNPHLQALGDGAVLPASGAQLVVSTDSFVVTPWQFPGGNIGKLAVCGTVNDICMAGGIPKWLSAAFILEEGFPMAELQEIVDAMAREARLAGVQIVTGDTKVVERGKGDGIYINTTGVGVLGTPGLTPAAIAEGDIVLASGSLGCHGAAIMAERGGLGRGSVVRSDCRCLHNICAAVHRYGGVRVLRDPTRGGAATVLSEFAQGAGLTVELQEGDIPVDAPVDAVCRLLGLDPLYCACEGRLLAVVAPESAELALREVQSCPGGEKAAIIGKITSARPGQVVLHTTIGGSRLLPKLTGALLPRIC